MQTQAQTPKFLTVDETCAVIHVGRTTLWRFIRDKKIPCTRVGRRILIPVMALDALQTAAMAGTPMAAFSREA